MSGRPDRTSPDGTYRVRMDGSLGPRPPQHVHRGDPCEVCGDQLIGGELSTAAFGRSTPRAVRDLLVATVARVVSDAQKRGKIT